MREIKFRAWDKKAKAFIAGFNMVNFHSYYNKEAEPHIFRYSNEWKLSDIELIQYTGLKDKNGKEIYEGNIIAHRNPDCNEIVYLGPFDNGEQYEDHVYGNGWHVKRIKRPNEIDHFTADDACEIEIIGNIYENPELLK